MNKKKLLFLLLTSLILILISAKVYVYYNPSNPALNQCDYYCSTTTTARGVLKYENHKYYILQYIEDESPIGITSIVYTYYVYKDSDLICVKTERVNTIELQEEMGF